MNASAVRLRAAARSDSARALSGTILGSAPGLLMPFLITLRFGASDLTDAFYFAYAVGSFSASLCNGSVAASLLPSLARARELGGGVAMRERARVLSRQSVLAVGAFHLVVTCAALVVVVVGTPWQGESQTLVALCLAALTLFVIAVALSTVQVAALQAQGDFFAPTASVGLRAMVPLLALAFVPVDATGLLLLALLTWAGELVRIAWLHRRVRRAADAAAGVVAGVGARAGGAPARGRVSDEMGGAAVGGAAVDHAGEEIWTRVAHNAIALAVLSASPLVTRAVGAHDGAGAVTLIELADRFLLIPWLALTASVVVVSAARWSRTLAHGDYPALISDFRRTRMRLVVASLAAAVVLAALAAGALLVIGERLVGDRVDLLIAMTAVLLITGLPPTIVGILTQRFLTVVGATRSLPALSALGFSVHVVAAVGGYAAFGLLGLVAATGVARLAMLGASTRIAAAWIADCEQAVGAGVSAGGVPQAYGGVPTSDGPSTPPTTQGPAT